MVFKYINNKKKAKNNGSHVAKQEEAEKAELLNAVFASVFTDNWRISDPGDQGTEYWKEDLPLVKENWVREHLGKFDICKSMSSDGIHLWVLTEYGHAAVGAYHHPWKVLAARSLEACKSWMDISCCCVMQVKLEKAN